MSQNLDATAINQIHALISAQGVNEIINNIGADAVALPENFRIHDLEKFNLNRFRFRGALSTASIDDFTRYSKDLADEGTRCFIDADNMRAVSVWICPYISRHLLSLNPLQARCRRYSRG
ncbi:DUF2303 family protein, partial [Escherichia coli]|uniref:DUF2303 family protein n=1 Tax=Escherichia coli TaxID=562 RepID=UPI0029393620